MTQWKSVFAMSAAPVPMTTGETARGSVRSRAAPIQSPRVAGATCAGSRETRARWGLPWAFFLALFL